MVHGMSLRVQARFGAGNVAATTVIETETTAEVKFAASPCSGSEALWFFFRVDESAPDTPHPETLTLTLLYIRNMTGCDSPASLHPTHRGEGQGWNRTRGGRAGVDEDGQACVSWTVPYPSPSVEFSLCYPYGMNEVKILVRKSKHYLSMNAIGLSQEGRLMPRISNSAEQATARPGLYLVARQHAGETPGSWVLDGMLQHFAKTRESQICFRAVPLVDIEGVDRGLYGRGNTPDSFGCAWGPHPTRHEARVIQTDLVEWQNHCKAAFVLDLQATGGSEHQGITCQMPSATEDSTAARDSAKWANVLSEGIGEEYAAENFKRETESASSPTAGLSLVGYARSTLNVSALTLSVPYALCGKTMMTPKQYREAGRRIARTIVRRLLVK
jgi:hypothetical protein